MIVAVSSLLFCLCKPRDLSIFPGSAVSPGVGGQFKTAGDRLSLAFSASFVWAAIRARKPGPVMNEFLNFITYHRDTVEWNGPSRAAKGITRHVF
jgi:hypothetical protein